MTGYETCVTAAKKVAKQSGRSFSAGMVVSEHGRRVNDLQLFFEWARFALTFSTDDVKGLQLHQRRDGPPVNVGSTGGKHQACHVVASHIYGLKIQSLYG